MLYTNLLYLEAFSDIGRTICAVNAPSVKMASIHCEKKLKQQAGSGVVCKTFDSA